MSIVSPDVPLYMAAMAALEPHVVVDNPLALHSLSPLAVVDDQIGNRKGAEPLDTTAKLRAPDDVDVGADLGTGSGSSS